MVRMAVGGRALATPVMTVPTATPMGAALLPVLLMFQVLLSVLKRLALGALKLPLRMPVPAPPRRKNVPLCEPVILPLTVKVPLSHERPVGEMPFPVIGPFQVLFPALLSVVRCPFRPHTTEIMMKGTLSTLMSP